MSVSHLWRQRVGGARPSLPHYARGMAKLVLTAIGEDKAGLVSALAGAVAAREGNWLESQMARLAGKFAGIVLVDVPEGAVDALVSDVEALGVLEVTVTRIEGEPPEAPGDPVVLHLLGNDHPGIVHQISQVLASTGVSIDELHTAAFEAPMAGGQLFEADAIVRIPPGMDIDELRDALEALASELMVDLELSSPQG